MASEFDPADFVDDEFRSQKLAYGSTGVGASGAQRAPSREETDSKVSEMRHKLSELKRVQEELERERGVLEELRRKQIEYATGRDEMLEALIRGTGILEESAFTARREAEQMSKTLADLQEALAKVQALNEETWTKENYNVELTRALTVLENARMEWNSARLKFPLLAGATGGLQKPLEENSPAPAFQNYSFGQLCRIGFALTWPVALVVLVIGVLMLLRR